MDTDPFFAIWDIQNIISQMIYFSYCDFQAISNEKCLVRIKRHSTDVKLHLHTTISKTNAMVQSLLKWLSELPVRCIESASNLWLSLYSEYFKSSQQAQKHSSQIYFLIRRKKINKNLNNIVVSGMKETYKVLWYII